MNLPGDRRLLIAVALGGTVVLISLLTVGTLTAAGDLDDDGLTIAEELDAGTEIRTADTDGDGLDDGEEASGPTDPTDADTDGDGLEDGAEVNQYGTDPTDRDSDGDELPDGVEVTEHDTNPTAADTDGDGLDDGVEINEHGTDPATADTDGDGLNDADEIEAGADPHTTDTDGDGLDDQHEVESHPSTDPADADTDDDGLDDGAEKNEYNTDPTEPDTDDDGLDDGREVELGTDPNEEDTDGDGLLDGWEVDGEVNGVEFPDADPLEKDLYIQINHGSQFNGLSDYERQAIEDMYSQMPVENPGGSVGIDAHVISDGSVGERLTYEGFNYQNLWFEGESQLGDREPYYRSVLLVSMDGDNNYIGLGDSPGRFSIAEGAPLYGSVEEVIVHETLHNIVGEIEADGACEDDPLHYCGGGILETRLGSGTHLPEAIGDQLDEDGLKGIS